jgi:hypothetical protein
VDWTAVGAIAELLGATAVVASLLYVARQMNQGNRIARAEAFRAAQLKLVDILAAMSQDSEWTELYVRLRYKGLERDDMSPSERTKAGFNLQTFLALYSVIHHDVVLGILPAEAYTAQLEEAFRTPYMKQVWPLLKHDHSEDFVRFMERRFNLVPPVTDDAPVATSDTEAS